MSKMIVGSNEEWRLVKGWPYEVSDFGRVRRSGAGAKNGHNTIIGRILKPNTDRYGYSYVRLCRNGKVKDFKVHRLVCMLFIGPAPFDRAEVRHNDGKPNNNRAINLSWGTSAQNAADRDLHGRTRRGETSPHAKLTNRQVIKLRRLHAQAQKGRQRVPRGLLPQLAEQFGLSVYGVSTIVSGRGYE